MKPLDNVRVIAIDSWMAAPSAAAVLADLGADVIKVEPLGGDPMRNSSRTPKIDDGPAKEYDYQFDVDNRGKRSIAVNLADAAGTEIVHRLISGADIFMCNLLQGRQERFKVTPDDLRVVNPKLVHATLTGYGTVGPDADRPGYDVTAFFGRSGLTHIMKDGEDGIPPMPSSAQGDHTTGLALVGGILAALRLAERTGEMQVVETSLFEAAVWTQASAYSVTAQDGAPFRPRSREYSLSPTMNRYRCSDGEWMVVNMPRIDDFDRMAALVGCEDMLEDERFNSFRNRFRNMPELMARWDEAIAAKSRAEWGEIFDKHGIVWGPVSGYDDVVKDPQAAAIGLFPSIDSGEFGDYRTVASPIRMTGVETDPTAPAPSLGQHTREVLTEAGIDRATIAELLDQGVVSEAT